jgi:hypothetical protein
LVVCHDESPGAAHRCSKGAHVKWSQAHESNDLDGNPGICERIGSVCRCVNSCTACRNGHVATLTNDAGASEVFGLTRAAVEATRLEEQRRPRRCERITKRSSGLPRGARTDHVHAVECVEPRPYRLVHADCLGAVRDPHDNRTSKVTTPEPDRVSEGLDDSGKPAGVRELDDWTLTAGGEADGHGDRSSIGHWDTQEAIGGKRTKRTIGRLGNAHDGRVALKSLEKDRPHGGHSRQYAHPACRSLMYRVMKNSPAL